MIVKYTEANTAYNKSTKKTQYELIHGYVPNFCGGGERQLMLNRNKWSRLNKLHQEAIANFGKKPEKMKTSYDKRHFKGVKLTMGKVVVMSRQPMAHEGVK